MFASLSTLATDYKLVEESMEELLPLSAQLCALIVSGEINFCSFLFIRFVRWHKNYHFHNLPAIIVTRYYYESLHLLITIRLPRLLPQLRLVLVDEMDVSLMPLCPFP